MKKYLLLPLLLIFFGSVSAWAVSLDTKAYNPKADSSKILSNQFWTEPKHNEFCETQNYSDWMVFERVVRNRPRRKLALNFAMVIGDGISRAINNEKFDIEQFKKDSLEAAQNNAFIYKEDSNSFGSPTYAQSVILRQAAMLLVFFDNRGVLSDPEREVIIKWGNKIARSQVPGEQGARANDSIGIIGVAKMAWGNASKQLKIFNEGYNAYINSLPLILGNIGDLDPIQRAMYPYNGEAPAENLNTNLHTVVEGAAVLHNLGLNGFEISYKGNTPRDAVLWFAKHMEETSWQPKPYFRHIRYGSMVWNLGWVPIYASIFPDAPETKILLDGYIKPAAKLGKPTLRAENYGGPVDCLWGFQSSWLN